MKRRWAGVTILGGVGFLGFLNQQLLGLLLEPAKQDLGLTDLQVGLLNGFGVAIFFAAAAFPIGWLADRYDRRVVLGGCLLVWSAATAACGLAGSIEGYAGGVIAMAIGESALIPIIYAAIPPIFPPEERPTANAIVYAMLVASSGLGLAAGGAALNSVEVLQAQGVLPADVPSWRLLFVAAGAIGLPMLALLAVIPPGTRQRAPAQQPEGFARFFRTEARTIIPVYLACGFFTYGWYALFLWTPAILSRTYGYSVARAGIDSGLVVLAASIVGTLLAWWAMRRWMPTLGPGSALRIMQWGCWAALPGVIALAFAPTAAWFLLLLSPVAAAIVFATAVAPLMLQQAAPNLFSSRAISLFPLLTLSLRGVMPLAIGWLSDTGGNTPRALLVAVCIVAGSALPLSIIMLRAFERAFGELVVRNGLAEASMLDEGRDHAER